MSKTYTWTISTSKGLVAEGASIDESNATRCAKEAAARRGLKRYSIDVQPVRKSRKSRKSEQQAA